VAAACVAVQALRSLLAHAGPEPSVFGIIVAASSLAVLPPLAYGKARLSRPLGSRALRGDAALTGAGALLAAIALTGVVLNRVFDWWWADPVAALIISAALTSEGMQTLRTPSPTR
jgi:divalent metal cation (Fe/Co/Zn/Cd) transporter